MPQRLAVIAFDDDARARELAAALGDLDRAGKLELRDLVLVRNEAGHIRVDQDAPGRGKAALSGAVWGGLFGALLAVPVVGIAVGAAASAGLASKLRNVGIEDSFVDGLRDHVAEGSTAVAVLVADADADAVLTELRRFAGARYLTGDLPDAAAEAVREALKTPEPPPVA